MSENHARDDRSENRSERRSRLMTLYVASLFAVCLGAAQGEDSAVVVEKAIRDSSGVLSHRVTSPYQSGATSIRVLLPEREPPREGFSVVYLLPVEAGDGNRWGDGLAEARKLDLHNRHGIICVAPTFSDLPWYADHPEDPGIRQETYFIRDVVPFIETTYPVRKDRDGRLLVGFSKSGWGAFSLLLRHPDLFGRAAAWDAPLTMQHPDRFGMGEIFATEENFAKYRITSLLDKTAKAPGNRPRLALFGYGNFRDHHQKLHEQMERLGIPHLYRDGPQRKHHWESGWLAEAVAWIVRGEETDKDEDADEDADS